ncbi:MAG TPA: ABC transporter permease [Kutzneria sp.]|jgi:oleandomycin transport system permease protein
MTASTLRHSLAICRRNLVHIRNDPEQLLDATVMPIVFTLVFLYVLGGAIGGDHLDYREYLLPGIMVQTASFASTVTGIGLNTDFGQGVMDRFRSLPISRAAVLAGRIGSDVCRLLLGQLVMLAFAFVVGFRVHTNPIAVLGAFALLLLYGTALCWVSAFVGLSVKNAQVVSTVGFLWMIPLQFGSSIFAPPDTMPGWLQAFVAINPTTLVTDACRGLLVGGPVAGSALGAIAWSVGLMVVFAPLAVLRYRNRT